MNTVNGNSDTRCRTPLRWGLRTRRILNAVVVAACVLFMLTAAAGSSACVFQDVEDVRPQALRDLIADTEEFLTNQQWQQAVEQFDAAWELACQREDPLLAASGTTVKQLAPGKTERLAGGRASLEELFMTAPEEFQSGFRSQFEGVAEARISEAIGAADFRGLRQLTLRYAFCPAAQKGIRILARQSMDRGDDLEAALLLDRLMRISGKSLSSKETTEILLQISVCNWRAGLNSDAVETISKLQNSSSATQSIPRLAIPISGTAADIQDWFTSVTGVPPTTALEWTQPGGSYRRFAIQGRGPARLTPAWDSDLLRVNDVLYEEQLNPVLQALRGPLMLDEEQQEQQNSVVVPAAVPLRVGELVIVRTPCGVRAVQSDDGSLVWEVTRPDAHVRDLLEMIENQARESRQVADAEPADSAESTEDPEITAAGRRGAEIRVMINRLAATLRHQWVRTNTAAQLSATHSTLFVCDECSGATSNNAYAFMFPNERRPLPASNFIRAYDLKTGLFKWEVGGQTQTNTQPKGQGNLLSGFYFLGAPLVLGNRIYVLAESGEGIFLLQIAEPVASDTMPANPRVVRSQLLTLPQFNSSEHPVRRHAGLVPSYAHGLLICPTCDERIVAVSAEDNAVRWIFRYASNTRQQELGGDARVLLGARNSMDSDRVDLDSRWTDSLPRIVGDHVLVTPRDSDELFCLDLQTGQERWKLPRSQFHSIAAIADDSVVLCGNRVVQAFRLVDGKSLWTSLISDGIVCGLPTTDGRLLQIPTSELAIVTIDLQTGRRLVTQRILSSLEEATGQVRGIPSPGNLLIIDGLVLSQNLDSLRAYSMGDGPPDTTIQATERLLQDDPDGAISLLEEGLQHEASPAAARELLIDVLMEGLRTNFAGNRGKVARIRQLINQADEDRPLESVLHLMLGMSLTDAAVLPTKLDRKSQRLSSELTRLTLQGLSGNETVDDDDLAGVLSAMLPELIAGQTEAASLGSLRRLNSLTFVAGIRDTLRRRTTQDRTTIQQQLQAAAVQSLTSATNPDSQIQFVMDLTTAGMPHLALHVLKSIDPAIDEAKRGLIKEQICLQIVREGSDDGTALTTLLDDWLASGDLTMINALRSEFSTPDFNSPLSSLRLVTPEAVASKVALEKWIDGHPDAIQAPVSAWGMSAKIDRSDHRTLLAPRKLPNEIPDELIPFYGSPGKFRGWSFVVLMKEQNIAAYDADGVIRWTLPIANGEDDQDYHLPSDSYLTTCGHLLLLNLRGLLYSLDTGHLVNRLDGNRQVLEPRVLWARKLDLLKSDPVADIDRDYVQAADRITQFAPQLSGYYPVAPVTPTAVAVIAGRRLLVYDTVTGRALWQLEGIARDAVLLTTHDAVIIISELARQIEKRSLIDGTQLQVARMPDWWGEAISNVGSSVMDFFELEPDDELPWRIVTHGESCVLFKLRKSKSTLECRDLMTDTVLWSIDFPAQSVFSNVTDDVVAVLGDGRELSLVRIDTGLVLTTQEVTAVPEPRDLLLVQSLGNYIVLPEAVDDPSVDLDPIMEAMHIYGRMYCVDGQSLALRWDEPIDHRFMRLAFARDRVILPNSPIMVLLNRSGPADPNSGIRRIHIGAKVIDVRTGKELINEDDVGITLNDFWLRIDAAQRQLELSFESRIYTIEFSDK
ncbi:MAG TPA: PQQ-binding-like beta-propeller repeat protein [Planctomycetaceae bacterium]|nr:PQQ-binding-like beta-propeller repeat protein [Planctomycetaceae bacterium]